MNVNLKSKVKSATPVHDNTQHIIPLT